MESDLPERIKISPLSGGMGSELKFSPVMKDDAGEYRCSVTNPLGSDNKMTMLRVKSKSEKSSLGLMATEKITLI